MRRSDSVRAAIVLAVMLSPACAIQAAAETRVAVLERPAAATQDAAFAGSAIAVALENSLVQAGMDATGRASVVAVYAEQGGAPIWLDDDRAAGLLAVLQDAEAHALPAARYGAEILQARLARIDGASDAERAALEADLTAAFTLYARDVSSGLMEPTRIDPEIEIYPLRPNPGALLRQVGAERDVNAFLAGLPPRDPAYRALQQALVEVRAIDPNAWGPEVPAGSTLKYGMRDTRVSALRSRLTALGFAPEAPLDGGEVDVLRVDTGLEDAVRRFQADRGLEDDGVVGSRTLAALNQSPRERLAQIAVNMERLRWHNRDLGRRHILVNQAAFEMALFEDGRPVLESRVVVGQSRKHRTPEFSDQMEYLVFNPYWNVPKSIARDEILPILKNDPSYLARNNMTATPWEGYSPPPPPAQAQPMSMSMQPGQELAQRDLDAPYRPETDAPAPSAAAADEAAADAPPAAQTPPYNPWKRYSSGYFPYTLRQNPGGGNALGDVKFLFPNHHSIYLHDTPSKKLFLRERRDFSHGCVRVQKPMELAEILLGWQTDDPTGLMARMLAYSSEKWITLQEPVPVHLTYRTAKLNDLGALDFLPDVYGRDALVAAALEEQGVALR